MRTVSNTVSRALTLKLNGIGKAREKKCCVIHCVRDLIRPVRQTNCIVSPVKEYIVEYADVFRIVKSIGFCREFRAEEETVRTLLAADLT